MAIYEETAAETFYSTEGVGDNTPLIAETSFFTETSARERWRYLTAADSFDVSDGTPTIAYNRTSSSTLGLDDTTVGTFLIDVAEGLGLADANVGGIAAAIAEIIGQTSAVVNSGLMAGDLADSFGLQDAVYVAFSEVVAEGYGATDNATYLRYQIASIAETLVQTDTVSSIHYANLIAAEVLGVTDFALRHFDATVAEGVGQLQAIVDSLRAQNTIAEGIGQTETAAHITELYITTAEEIGLADGQTVNQILYDLISEGVSLGGTMLSFDNVGTAWVINTNSTGISEYDNYSFNSFAKRGTQHLAASDSNIYSLAGSDDAGTNISAVLRFGLDQLRTSRKKRVSDLYIGYKSDGSLVLKAVYNMDNEQREAWYELTDTSNAFDNARFKVGKGAKATYWAFELVNNAGADFDLDSIEMHVVPLKRRL